MKSNTDLDSNLILDGHKLWLPEHRDRLEAWQMGERIVPITIDMALTRSCNYRCEYCYATLQDNDIKKMTLDVIYRFLDDASEMGVKAISFVSDGESTCSPHLYDAILRGHNNGLSMALGTAGYLLKDERLEEILPALTYLRFNMSAGVPSRYSEIHGVPKDYFNKVVNTVIKAVDIKRKKSLGVTIGLQMVLLSKYKDQIIPLSHLGKVLGVDYLVLKHCSDDQKGSLGVDFSSYHEPDIMALLDSAEALSSDSYTVKAKRSKIFSDGKRCYSRCYGPPFFLQFSGSGLVAPCGMLFGKEYKKYHIGNIAEKSFKEIWQSDRYWEVLNILSSGRFDAQTMCGCLCIQHKINEFLWSLKEGNSGRIIEECDKIDSFGLIHRNFL
ncbi:MAG: radical SAM protein [Parcubacteria group bacterium]|nr:radical SAM protein [Parcubacteria group bacterium]MCR4342524.1 radical SAM protein [Patescibacteria group bacterium]